MKAKEILKIFTPQKVYVPIYDFISTIKVRYRLIQLQRKRKKALLALKTKDKIRCVFFAIYDSNWKFDSLFKLMEKHSRFEPIILVCPVIDYGREHMLTTMNQCYITFKKKGYNVIKSYNYEEDSYIDVKKELHPDIIFYTNPYKGLIDSRYYILNFLDVLTAYTPYGFNSTIANKMIYDQLLNNMVWRLYTETYDHLELYRRSMRNKGKNCVVTGYAGVDELLDKHYRISHDPWLDHTRKRIIWAPHHTIERVEMIKFSCFLRYCDFMVEMAQKYEKKIQIIFKPHPILYEKLKTVWGEERTNSYYEKWKSMPNTDFNDGEYIDLFLTSDAMIHDSGSFLIEYLYVNKPVMRTMSGEDMSMILNDLAMDALDVYYQAFNEKDIENFFVSIINGKDEKLSKRTSFIKERLMPPNQKLASENILIDILDSVDNQKLYHN